jgi:hypothetical protein
MTTSDSTPTPEWWDEIRVPVAFLVAPAIVPLSLCMTPASFGLQGVDAFILMVAAIVGYIGTFVIGIPLYLELRAWNVTAFWVAPVIGIAAGLGLGSALSVGGFLRGAQAFGAVAGALVAMVLWAIARPDRRALPSPGGGYSLHQGERPDASRAMDGRERPFGVLANDGIRQGQSDATGDEDSRRQPNEEALQTTSGEAGRVVSAFVFAPLALPLLLIVYGASVSSPGGFLPGLILVAVLLTSYAYLGVYILGAPIYFVLRAFKLTAFWIAPIAGFIPGAMMIGAIFGAKAGIVTGGLPGALVATVFWVIARPDRQAQPLSEEGAPHGLPSQGEG